MSSRMTTRDRRGRRERGPTVRIARATPRDAKRLTAMVRRSRAYEGGYASMVAGYRVGPDYIEAHSVHIAIGEDDALLGFYALLLDPPELDLMFVADRAQGLGVGRQLITHMITEARSAGLAAVRVVSHPPAEGFYRSVGAERTGTVAAQPSVVNWDRPELMFHLDRLDEGCSTPSG
ncbi:GNAT family N-acetyltransferase [Streptomyces sp. NPDC005953]|uniref:GNAT family N-acetyltransferase n=1 Tax=Streptomyces sp. NPDC005953 TaxID=3156719 RepID=UPI00340E9493